MRLTSAVLLSVTTTPIVSALYYPNWGKTNSCVNDGLEPAYMENSGYLFTNKNDCCASHFAWDVATCMGDDYVTSKDLYYADWLGDNSCKNDGLVPAYMLSNPTLWLHDTLSSCCKSFKLLP